MAETETGGQLQRVFVVRHAISGGRTLLVSAVAVVIIVVSSLVARNRDCPRLGGVHPP